MWGSLQDGMPNISYSICKDYVVLVQTSICMMGMLIVLDDIWGKGFLLGDASQFYEMFVSNDYSRFVVQLGTVGMLVYYAVTLKFVRMFSGLLVSFLVIGNLSSTKGQTWKIVLIFSCIFWLLAKVWELLERKANRLGYSILYPEIREAEDTEKLVSQRNLEGLHKENKGGIKMEGYICGIKVEGYETYKADFESVAIEDCIGTEDILLDMHVPAYVYRKEYGWVAVELESDFTRDQKSVTFFFNVLEGDDGIRIRYNNME